MGPADYRMMSEATGQRIAAALEALSGFGAYLTTADVVDNLTSTATDKPLSAAQGKALNDQIANVFCETPDFSVSPNSSTEIDYPSGYNKYNTRIVSFVIATFYVDYKNISFELKESKIRIVNDTSQTWNNVKLLLYKV